jgi:hypothetical protein
VGCRDRTRTCTHVGRGTNPCGYAYTIRYSNNFFYYYLPTAANVVSRCAAICTHPILTDTCSTSSSFLCPQPSANCTLCTYMCTVPLSPRLGHQLLCLGQQLTLRLQHHHLPIHSYTLLHLSRPAMALYTVTKLKMQAGRNERFTDRPPRTCLTLMYEAALSVSQERHL